MIPITCPNCEHPEMLVFKGSNNRECPNCFLREPHNEKVEEYDSREWPESLIEYVSLVQDYLDEKRKEEEEG